MKSFRPNRSEISKERIEMIKIVRNSIESNINERNFFIKNYGAAVTLCAIGYGILINKFPHQADKLLLSIAISFCAILICGYWSKHMEVYRILLRARYYTIHEIEKPLLIRPHTIELEERKLLELGQKEDWHSIAIKKNISIDEAEKKYMQNSLLLKKIKIPTNNSDMLVWMPTLFSLIFVCMSLFSLYNFVKYFML